MLIQTIRKTCGSRVLLGLVLALFVFLPASATAGTFDPVAVEHTVSRVTGEIAPEVSVEELESRIEEKGMDVVHVLQKVGLPVCTVLFILFCLHFLTGFFGNGRMLWQSLLGMGCTGIAYTGILEGEAIVRWIAAWIVS